MQNIFILQIDHVIALLKTILNTSRIKYELFSRVNKTLEDLYPPYLSDFNFTLLLIPYILDTLSFSLSHLKDFALAFPSRMLFTVIIIQSSFSVNLQTSNYLML